jgi:hypothetical protein
MSRVFVSGAGVDDGQGAEFLDDAPTADEWRRAVGMIAEQVLLRIAGYTNKEEFAKDGCRFLWHRFQSVTRAATHGGQRARADHLAPHAFVETTITPK